MILETTNLTKQFGKTTALNQVSLQIQEGEIFGLVGPDGAGKTTFIRTVLGLYLPTSGRFELLNSENPENIKSQIGYVPQEFSLSQDMTVWENLSLFGSLYGISGKRFNQRAHELLQLVRMEPFKDRLAGNLSGGMKQKLALTAGLLHAPKFLILDEPTTGVDPVSRREFWQLLYKLNKEGLTLLVSTPYMDEVELCHRLAFCHHGEIKAVGSPEELLAQYPHQILALEGQNLRSMLSNLQQIPALDVYMQGEKVHIILDKNQTDSIPKIEKFLSTISIESPTLTPLSPTLEDLFSTLSADQEVAL